MLAFENFLSCFLHESKFWLRKSFTCSSLTHHTIVCDFIHCKTHLNQA
jgi:hypothetical protein